MRGKVSLQFSKCVPLAIVLAACAGQALAQQPVGGVRGKVLDPEFNATLPNATIVVEGTGKGTQSGEDGSFTISDLPPGNYEITVSREGYSRARVANVIVNEGRFAEVSVEMLGLVVELEDFVVTAEDLVGSQQFQLDIQQSLVSMANVMGSEFISRLGASNVGQALQKVAGINVVGDRYVVIRGLADRYNAVILNNAAVPSSDPDRRAVNIDLFPASVVRTLQTSKTFTPDLPGEATGGSVNIVTKGVPEKNYTKFKLGVGGNTLATGNDRFLSYMGGGTGMLGTLDSRRLPDFIKGAPLAREIRSGDKQEQIFRDRVLNALPRTMGTTRREPGPDMNMELTVAKRGEFMGLPAGVLLGLDYRKGYSYDPAGLQSRSANERLNVERGSDNLRASMILVGGVELQPGDELKLTYFGNLSAQDRASLLYGPKDITIPESDRSVNDFKYRESLAYTERRLNVLQASGRHHWETNGIDEGTVLNWVATYSFSSQDEPDHRFIEADSLNLEQFALPAVLTIPPVRRYWRELDDDRWSIGTDIERVLFSEGSKETKIKVGGVFDHASREYRADSFASTLGRSNDQGFPSVVKPSPFPGATWGDVWFYGNPANADIDPAFPNTGTYLYRFVAPEFYSGAQMLPSGFAMINSDITEKFNITFGLRYEGTQIDIRASDIAELGASGGEGLDLAGLLIPNSVKSRLSQQELLQLQNDLANLERGRQNPIIQAARNVRLNESTVLPAFTAKWDISDEFALRGAYSRTIARPSFKELAPVAFRDAESGDTFIGNSDLRISDIDNYDIRFEYFPKSGGTFAVSGFSKFINDPIEKAGGGGIEQYQNSPDGSVYGFELEFDKNLAFLDDSLKCLSLGGNYTFIRSVVPRLDFSTAGGNRRLQGQPDYILNFNLNFDEPDLGISAGVFLNVTGAYLDAVGFANSPDVFVEPTTSLNAFLAYRYNPNLKFTLRANNLTAQPVTRIYNDGNRSPYDTQNTATSYSLSVELEF